MDANLSMEQIRKDVKNVTELNQEGYDMDVISHTRSFKRLCTDNPYLCTGIYRRRHTGCSCTG